MSPREPKRGPTSNRGNAPRTSEKAKPRSRSRAPKTAEKTAPQPRPETARNATPPDLSAQQSWADDFKSNLPFVERLSDGRWILASWDESAEVWQDETLDVPTKRTAATLEALAEAGAPTYATLREAKKAALERRAAG